MITWAQMGNNRDKVEDFTFGVYFDNKPIEILNITCNTKYSFLY